ncbi:MAG: ATP-binding cassette domain-containing protein [Desulfobulbaceae bacterium]|nr:ATP-binding cassette domain-containing protein [Desulfobulbaceae bacterium]
MLRIENLHVAIRNGGSVGPAPIIKELNFTLDRGELLGTIGASGSGKSTLARALLGVLPSPVYTINGMISFQGIPLTGKHRASVLKNRIAYMPQLPNALNPLFKVGSQLRRMAVRKGLQSQEEIDRALDSGLQAVRLHYDVLNLYPYQLSTGMARRVFLAGAFLRTPELIIADEPTAGLDEELSEEIMTIIRNYVDNGGTALIISHDLKSLLRWSDGLSVLLDGNMIELTRRTSLSENFSVRHPYTNALIDALPSNGFNVKAKKMDMSSSPCPFFNKCTTKCPQPFELPRAKFFVTNEMVMCHAAVQ